MILKRAQNPLWDDTGFLSSLELSHVCQICTGHDMDSIGSHINIPIRHWTLQMEKNFVSCKTNLVWNHWNALRTKPNPNKGRTFKGLFTNCCRQETEAFTLGGTIQETSKILQILFLNTDYSLNLSWVNLPMCSLLSHPSSASHLFLCNSYLFFKLLKCFCACI